MNKYLLEILKEANTIIIPGLGALTITNKEKGEIMFMSYLKHDDGKLSAYIANKDGIDEADAKNLIAKYVREIQAALDKGESFDMFEFGKFSKNDGGDIEFTATINGSETEKTKETIQPLKKEGAKAEKKAPEIKEVNKEVKAEEKTPIKKSTTTKVVAKKVAEKKESIKTLEKKVTPKKPDVKIKKVPKDKEIIAKNVTEKKAVPTVNKVETTKPVEKKITPIVAINPKNDPPKKPQEDPNTEAGKSEVTKKESIRKSAEKKLKPVVKKEKTKEKTKEKKKRGVGFWILMVLLVVLLGGGTYFGLNYDKMKQYVPFLADEKVGDTESNALDEMRETMGGDKTDSNENSDTENDEIIDKVNDENDEVDVVEDPIDETTNETPVNNTPLPITSGNDPYHIIAGAFSSQKNANRLAKKLQGEGLPASVIMNGGMHTVSMKSFSSAADANASLAEMKEYSGSAWVLFKQ